MLLLNFLVVLLLLPLHCFLAENILFLQFSRHAELNIILIFLCFQGGWFFHSLVCTWSAYSKHFFIHIRQPTEPILGYIMRTLQIYLIFCFYLNDVLYFFVNCRLKFFLVDLDIHLVTIVWFIFFKIKFCILYLSPCLLVA